MAVSQAGQQLAQNALKVEVAAPKLEYLLRAGAGKVEGFARLGYSSTNTNALQQMLANLGAKVDTASGGVMTQYGTKFTQISEIAGPNGVTGRVTTVWQIDQGAEGVLRFITAWVEVFK